MKKIRRISNYIKKIKTGLIILQNEGLIIFLSQLLELLLLKINKRKCQSQKEIYTIVKYEDAIRVNLNGKPPKWSGSARDKLRFNWIMPPPGKGSGGHMNIYRFIDALENVGHGCRIYLYAQGGPGNISKVKLAMGDSYPDVKAPMEWLEDGKIMEPAEGIIATSWETAYVSYLSKLEAKRFYFVQDFEPFFYPPGSLYVLAENTYRFSFFGITAGKWLAKKLNQEYSMKTDYYEFGVDKFRYHITNMGRRGEILFYARPYTERRGFELGIMALDIFHRIHPEIIINFAGYDISNYRIPFPYENLKIIELDNLNTLYNRCAAGLVLSFTNMSLLPLELLSSGVIPVVNEGENNRLVSDNEFIAYSKNDPSSLAQSLSKIVSKVNLPDYAKAASKSVEQYNWIHSMNKFIHIIERETRKHG
jgi:hypothetical protein